MIILLPGDHQLTTNVVNLGIMPERTMITNWPTRVPKFDHPLALSRGTLAVAVRDLVPIIVVAPDTRVKYLVP